LGSLGDLAGKAPPVKTGSSIVANQAVERIQRGKMILDVATADLEAAEATLGAVHPTSWYFRQSLADARLAWDRLRAEFGGIAMDKALEGPPVAVLRLRPGAQGRSSVVLIPIGGRTFRVERIAGTDPAPIQRRLTRLSPPLEFGPYYACRLRDGTTQCDCAEWAYREEAPGYAPCKHLAALDALGWI
jgi:hypothetical protein